VSHTGDIRLNFVITTASSSQRVLLSDQDLLKNRWNTRVVGIPTHSSLNRLGRPYLVFCTQDVLKPRKGTPVCLYENQWHTITQTKGAREVAVGQPYPLAHHYDLNEEEGDTSAPIANEPIIDHPYLRTHPHEPAVGNPSKC
jgi:hypothetical protein